MSGLVGNSRRHVLLCRGSNVHRNNSGQMQREITSNYPPWKILDPPHSISTNMSCDKTKPTKWLYAQQRLRSAWASAQSDQSLRCPHEESLGPYLPIEHIVKILIRLGGCTGWSESSLGAHSLCWFCHEVAQFWTMKREITSNYPPWKILEPPHSISTNNIWKRIISHHKIQIWKTWKQ